MRLPEHEAPSANISMRVKWFAIVDVITVVDLLVGDVNCIGVETVSSRPAEGAWSITADGYELLCCSDCVRQITSYQGSTNATNIK